MNEQDLFSPVYRVCAGGGGYDRYYHSNLNCYYLKLARSVRKTKLGAMIDGKFKKHC